MYAIDPDWVRVWSRKYDAKADELYYFPYIERARQGDRFAITELTKWKNPGSNGRPMNLSKNKQKSLDFFLADLARYRAPGGEQALRADFRWKAPVWSIFWAHILYGTPIFDRYTYASYMFFSHGSTLSREQAIICCPHHWDLFDKYHAWFETTLEQVSRSDSYVNSRRLDQALWVYGERLLARPPTYCRP